MEHEFSFEKTLKVYSGVHGCMCGCKGRYSYPTHAQEEAGQERGYEVHDDEVSDRSVKIIVGKFQGWAEEFGIVVSDHLTRLRPYRVYDLGDGLFCFDTDTRSYLLKEKKN